MPDNNVRVSLGMSRAIKRWTRGVLPVIGQIALNHVQKYAKSLETCAGCAWEKFTCPWHFSEERAKVQNLNPLSPCTFFFGLGDDDPGNIIFYPREVQRVFDGTCSYLKYVPQEA